MRLSNLARRAWPHAALFALWALFFWRYYIPGANRLMYPDGDFTQQFFIFRDIAYRALAQGHLPLWSNCFFAGYPFNADPQSQLFYPPVWLSFGLLKLMGWGNFPLLALTVEATLHYLLASVLTFFFLRVELTNLAPAPASESQGSAQSTTATLAAVFGAVAFTYGGYLTSYPPLQTGVLETVTWLPLILLALNRLADPVHAARNVLGRVVVCAFAMALAFFAGHPQTFLFVGYLSVAYFIHRAALHQRPWRWTLAVLAGVLAMVVGLSLVQLLPQAQYLTLSTRSSLTYDQLAEGFTLGVIVHILFADNTWSPLYLGVLPLTMALVAVASVLRVLAPVSAYRRSVIFWLVAAVIGLLISFGGNAAAYPLAYWLAPGFQLFRRQERLAMVMAFSSTVLSAFGVWIVLAQANRTHRVLLRRAANAVLHILPLAVAVLVMVSALRTAYPDAVGLSTLPDRTTVFVFGLGLSVLALYAALRFAPGSRAGWIGGLFIGVAALELFTATTPSNKVTVFDPYPYYSILDPIQADATPFFRVQDDAQMQGHFACGYGLAEWGGISPIRLASWQAFESLAPEALRWKLMGTKYLITWKNGTVTREGDLPAAVLVAEGPAPKGDGDTKVYQLFEIPRRAWFVYDYASAAEITGIFDVISANSFEPFVQAALLESDVHLLQLLPQVEGEGSLEVIEDWPGHMVINTASNAPGLLVVSEAYYPGWAAEVNDVSVPVIQADGYLQAVPVPAGNAVVQLNYRPPALMWGALISVFTLILGIGLVIADHYSVFDRITKRND